MYSLWILSQVLEGMFHQNEEEGRERVGGEGEGEGRIAEKGRERQRRRERGIQKRKRIPMTTLKKNSAQD